MDDHVCAEGIRSVASFRESEGLEGWQVEMEEYVEDFVQYLEEEYSEPKAIIQTEEEDSWMDEFLTLESEEHASREEVLEYADEIYEVFEEVLEMELLDEDRAKLEEMHIYDESIFYRAKEGLSYDNVLLNSAKGGGVSLVASTLNIAAAIHSYDHVYESTGSFQEASKVSDQLFNLVPFSLALPVLAGAGYGVWKSMHENDEQFDGFYRSQGSGFGPKLFGEAEERRIAIDSGTLGHATALGITASENMHLFQDLTNSDSFDEFMMVEGMDAASIFTVFDNVSNVHGIDNQELEEERDFFKLGILTEAYAALKNQGAESVDPMTFTSLGLDPEISKRISNHVEYSFEEDYSDSHFYSGAIGGTLLMMGMERHSEKILGDVIRGDFDKVPLLEEAEDLIFSKKP